MTEENSTCNEEGAGYYFFQEENFDSGAYSFGYGGGFADGLGSISGDGYGGGCGNGNGKIL